MLRRLIIFIIAIFLAGCGDKTTGPVLKPCDLPCQLDKSPFPDAEAEAAALYLGGGVVAKEAYYNECLDAFKRWREQYKSYDTSWWFNVYPNGSGSHWVNSVDQRFLHPLGIGRLILYFNNDSIGQTVLNGTYHNWDSLNSFYHLDSSEITSSSGFIFGHLYFHGLLDGKVLAELYQDLPGLWYIDYHVGGYMDGNYLYIGRDSNNKICFVSDFGWDDCYSGCISHKSYYFKQRWNSIKRIYEFAFIGSYLSYDPEPEWWPEALQNIRKWWDY